MRSLTPTVRVSAARRPRRRHLPPAARIHHQAPLRPWALRRCRRWASDSIRPTACTVPDLVRGRWKHLKTDEGMKMQHIYDDVHLDEKTIKSWLKFDFIIQARKILKYHY